MKSLLLWYNNTDFSTRLSTYYPQTKYPVFVKGQLKAIS
nr:MAG TPA: hypothetical protein [Bacteriophage sp.]